MSEKTCNCNCAENRREQFKELQPVLDQYAKGVKKIKEQVL